MTVIPGGASAEALRYAGQDLKALGVYCEVIDGVASTPPIRGSNLLVPYQHGRRAVTKYYDERPVVLTGEMLSTASRSDFYAKLDQLKQLFTIGRGEQKLEVQRQDGSYRYVMAEVRNTMGLEWQTWPTKSSPFSVELAASDPLWYGSDLEASQARQAWAFDSGVSFDDWTHWFDLTSQAFARTLTAQVTIVEASNGGTHYTRKPVFLLTGAMTNPKLSNLRNGYSVQVSSAVAVGQQLVIDCGAQAATIGGQSQPLSKVALGKGQVDWMRLEAGENSLQINVGVATPSVAYSAQYSPAYL